MTLGHQHRSSIVPTAIPEILDDIRTGSNQRNYLYREDLRRNDDGFWD